ncbi:MAG: methyl-accepting chemotaxis protein [Desulfobacterales bacterium]|nr:methyl-accepting chemotaxis protein [Desulfobacterales bacterium]
MIQFTKNIKISTKLTLISFFLLFAALISSYNLIIMQRKGINDFINKNIDNINLSISDRKSSEELSLYNNVKFNAEMLSHVCTEYIFQYVTEGIKISILAYMKYPEIVAISVFDDMNEPIISAWKKEDIKTGMSLPKEFEVNNDLIFKVNSFKNDRIVGKIYVYYTDKSIHDKMSKIKKKIVSDTSKSHNTLLSSLNKVFKYQVIAILVLIIAIGIAFRILKRLTIKPLDELAGVANRLKNYDLSVGIHTDRKDEIGNLLMAEKDMIKSLREIISKVSENVVNIDLFAENVSKAVFDLASIFTQQSSSITEISSTMEQFAASSSQIAKNSEYVVQISDNTLQSSKKGSEYSTVMMKKIYSINEENEKSIKQLIELKKKIDEITKVMEIINGIASQTKLIAFNAALEAAGSGEAGKRFNVVASEIRRLAEIVTESTGDIENKINEIQEASNYMVIVSEKNSQGINDSLNSFSETVELLKVILSEAQSTTDVAKQISSSTLQQHEATRQVVKALSDIESSLHSTSKAINEISLISQQLKEVSDNLQSLMKKFNLS